MIDSPHMAVYVGCCIAAAAATAPAANITATLSYNVVRTATDTAAAAAAVVARRVFDRGVFVRFPVGFCHRIQLRAKVLAWSDY